jgi:hypothetical protein
LRGRDLRAEPLRADLRAVAVREHETIAMLNQLHEVAGCQRRVRALFGDATALSSAQE